MREIEFRGKDHQGQWHYGNLVKYTEDDGEQVACIVSTARCEISSELVYIQVDETTIGQFTGLTDKNGKKIYEGDILRLQTFKNLSYETPFDEQDEYRRQFSPDDLKGEMEAEAITAVCYEEGLFMVSLDWENDTYISCLFGDMKGSQPIFEYEVIGNIFDNPELLKEKEE